MKKVIVYFLLPLFALLSVILATATAQAQESDTSAENGVLQKMLAVKGDAEMKLDLDRISDSRGSNAATFNFQVAANSFFTVLVFNDLLRGPDAGSMGLVSRDTSKLPAALRIERLVVEKQGPEEAFDLVVRDGKSGFVFFNISGHEYSYDAGTKSLGIKDGRLELSDDFARKLGRPADAGSVVGKISISAGLIPIEVDKLVDGKVQSAVMPSIGQPDVGTVPGPDVIVGDLPAVQQPTGGIVNGFVGLGVGTTSCNAGVANLNWVALPSNDHPAIPQNMYRMSGGADNTERFEQIGQGWCKHAFTALTENICGFGCNGTGGAQLGSGCSDPYSASLNYDQTRLGSRAWINPFTGAYPRGDSATNPNSHTNHSHTGTSHRLLVAVNDLVPASNPGATYFAEGQYVTPHEYAWCQSHPGQCNMNNNVSYRRFTPSFTTNFTFAAVGSTVRTQPAINAWTGATRTTFEPDPGNDGIGTVGYKVTNPSAGVWHYEYAVYNQNLDRAIQSFSVPLGCGVNVSNLGFHAPTQPAAFAADGTLNSAGYSATAWTPVQAGGSVTWSSETFAQNQNANAIRWGTLYNFRFDSTQPPTAMNATIGFYKTGQPITVAIQGPTPVQCNPFSLTTAVSRKTHGASGIFDIDLPLSGSPGIECRNSGGGNHMIVITFSNNVVSGNAAVTNGTGTVSGSPTFSGNVMTVNLTGVPSAQQLTLTFSGVTDSFGQTYPDTPLVMKALLGDSNGSSSVSTSDIAMVKSETSNPVTQANFREDLNADGSVSSSDVGAVKSMAGATLP